ncbi:phosphotransferase family protein [Asanoa siamensis]|uniref:Aminoglycoside phosphotransferase domain-containing protein n=1 Tax=Asanoa siamensis TaxID=926357 RepID=A0ABQ4CL57_9ACTN|nr:phosphotransferase [Asanoa siamensis]GIF72011.1 hypothetical protein Asi02nite_15290 [Asanoa siamensis]
MIADLVAARLPGYRVDSVVEIGSGLDNVAYEVNGELIVRISQEPDPAETSREARLLAAVAGVVPVPVPQPVFTVAELGCLAYFTLAGVPLLDLPERSARAAVTLGEVLAALHRAPAATWAGLAEVDVLPLAEWLAEAAETYASVAGQIPAPHRAAVEAFLAAPPPPDDGTAVFSHNDLGIEHVLVDPASGAVTGIIDWSDAALVDPAYDFGLIHRDLGPAALDAALARYGPDAALRERAVFYARCTLFEDLAYGRAPYVAKSLAALDWLF